MGRQLRELQEVSDRACFVNPNVFYAHDNFDWLKPYILLYDRVVLDSRHDFSFQGAEARSKLSVWPWLEKNALFLEDFEVLPENHWTAVPPPLPVRLPPAVRSTMLTKRNYFNRKFLRTFERKVNLRRGGAADWSRAFRAWKPLLLEVSPILMDDGAVSGENVIPFYKELVGAWRSLQVSLVGGPPSVQDPLSSWLVRRIYRAEWKEDPKVARFHEILIRDIPDFTNLPWKSILELRESRQRRHCLRHLQELVLKPKTDVQEELQASFWRLATEAYQASSIPKTLLKGIAGNLPIPIVNPIGLGLSLHDLCHACDSQTRFGWLYYLVEIRNRALESKV
jgi:hypothetical protein